MSHNSDNSGRKLIPPKDTKKIDFENPEALNPDTLDIDVGGLDEFDLDQSFINENITSEESSSPLKENEEQHQETRETTPLGREMELYKKVLLSSLTASEKEICLAIEASSKRIQLVMDENIQKLESYFKREAELLEEAGALNKNSKEEFFIDVPEDNNGEILTPEKREDIEEPIDAPIEEEHIIGKKTDKDVGSSATKAISVLMLFILFSYLLVLVFAPDTVKNSELFKSISHASSKMEKKIGAIVSEPSISKTQTNKNTAGSEIAPQNETPIITIPKEINPEEVKALSKEKNIEVTYIKKPYKKTYTPTELQEAEKTFPTTEVPEESTKKKEAELMIGEDIDPAMMESIKG